MKSIEIIMLVVAHHSMGRTVVSVWASLLVGRMWRTKWLGRRNHWCCRIAVSQTWYKNWTWKWLLDGWWCCSVAASSWMTYSWLLLRVELLTTVAMEVSRYRHIVIIFALGAISLPICSHLIWRWFLELLAMKILQPFQSWNFDTIFILLVDLVINLMTLQSVLLLQLALLFPKDLLFFTHPRSIILIIRTSAMRILSILFCHMALNLFNMRIAMMMKTMWSIIVWKWGMVHHVVFSRLSERIEQLDILIEIDFFS